jgi:hypothetical protein
MLVALPGSALAAEIFEKVGTFDGQFLKIGVGARAAGMGGAYVAVANDASSVFWNPAGLALIPEDEQEVSLNHAEWPAGLNFDQATLAFHIGGLPGILAVNARSLSMSEEPVRTAFRPEGTGEFFDAGYTAFGASYSRFLTDKFSIGLSANYVRLGLAEFSEETVAFDLGTLYDVGTLGMKIGMAIQNIGSSVQFIEMQGRIPTVFRVGTAFSTAFKEQHNIIGSFEFSHPPDNAERANIGGEYGFRDFLFLRAGYNLNYDSQGLAAGAGVLFPISSIRTKAAADYAYTDMGDLGGVHRISVRILF